VSFSIAAPFGTLTLATLLGLVVAPGAGAQEQGAPVPLWPRTLDEAAELPERPQWSPSDLPDERDPRRIAELRRALGALPAAPERPAPDTAALRERIEAEEEAVAFDEPGDGALWVRGQTYKARLDGERLTYVPFLGSQAPRNFPVTLELRSATLGGEPLALASDAEPVREGNRVVVARGAIDEVYDFRPDGVEQSFLVRRASVRGELALEIAVESELALREEDGEGLFENELGGVRCSRAFTFDEDGRGLATATAFRAGRIDVRVPAEEVERARGDLLVDPILSTFLLMPSASDHREPTVAYDAANDRYLVAFEEVWSQSDFDIRAAVLSGASPATPVVTGYVDFTGQDWRHASAANLNAADQFLVAADTSSSPRSIRGRTVTPGLAMGPQFTISDTSVNLGAYYPVVGGDSFPSAPSFYCVAWALNLDDANFSIGKYALVTPQGTTLGVQTFATVISWFRDEPGFGIDFDSTLTEHVPLAISKSNGGSEWTIAWGSGQLLFPSNVSRARVGWSGSITAPETVVAPYLRPDLIHTRTISVSSPNSAGSTLLAWEDIASNVFVVRTSLLNPATGAGPIQNQTNPGFQSFFPSVDSNGSRFTLAFRQSGVGVPRYQIRQLATVGTSVFVTEQVLHVTGLPEIGRPEVCSERAAAGSRLNCLIGGTTWTMLDNSQGWHGGDVFLAHYMGFN
jgi:hypothetical protein